MWNVGPGKVTEVAVSNLLSPDASPRRWEVESGQVVTFSPECDALLVFHEDQQTIITMSDDGSLKRPKDGGRRVLALDAFSYGPDGRQLLVALGTHGQEMAVGVGDDVVYVDNAAHRW